jgi:integrase
LTPGSAAQAGPAVDSAAGRRLVRLALLTFALQRRKAARRGDHAIPAARLEKLFTDDRHPLRERTLWRLLYETAARAEEILCLNVEDLDVEYRRARVVSKSGAVEHVTGPPPASCSASCPVSSRDARRARCS